MPSRLFLACALLAYALANANTRIRSDTTWRDTTGNAIHAHGGGMLWHEPKQLWYWYGESAKGMNYSRAINLYSSASLGGPWKREGQPLQQSHVRAAMVKKYGAMSAVLAEDAAEGYILERPSALWHVESRLVVVWLHVDDTKYQKRLVAVATAKSPIGPFGIRRLFQPDGQPSLDLNVAQSAARPSEAYLTRSVGNEYVAVSKLSADWQDVDKRGILHRIRPCGEGEM